MLLHVEIFALELWLLMHLPWKKVKRVKWLKARVHCVELYATFVCIFH